MAYEKPMVTIELKEYIELQNTLQDAAKTLKEAIVKKMESTGYKPSTDREIIEMSVLETAYRALTNVLQLKRKE